MPPWLLPVTMGASALADLFSSGKPYQAGSQAASQEFNQARSDMMPFIQSGQNAINPLTTAANSLLNPAQLRQQWLNSYQESPEAKYEENMATQEGLNSAASQGLLGSTAGEQAIQQGTGLINLQDQQNYLQDLMNKYMGGVNTMRGMYSTGANLTGWMGEGGLAENAGNVMGNLAYGRAQAPLSMLNRLIGTGMGYELGGKPGAEAAMGFSGPQINAINGQPSYTESPMYGGGY